MTEAEKLSLLKQDLQMLTAANDEYLSHLLELSAELMKKEGIYPEDTVEYSGLQRQYAAFLFRKRDDNAGAMPRFLRLALNNLKLSQLRRTP